MSRPEDFKFDPYSGLPWGSAVPIQMDTYRSLYPKRVFWANPWTGQLRDTGDVNENPFMEHVAPPLPPIVDRDEPRRRVHGATTPYKSIMSLDECCAAEGAQPGAIQFVGPEPTDGEVDPTGRGAHDAGAKMDAGKPRVWLCVSGFSNALAAVADVTTRGAEKYAPNSWMSVPDGVNRYMEGFGRHTLALGRGETHDTGPGGTGCLHKAQMIWNLLASLELEIRNDAGWSRGS